MTSKKNKQIAETYSPNTVILTIRELKKFKNFESAFFDDDFLASGVYNRNWEEFVSTRALQNQSKKYPDTPIMEYNKKKLDDRLDALNRLGEIIQIGNGKWKTPRTIEIDLSEPGRDQLFLCYIVYFVRGKTSASYRTQPLGFIVQSPEFQRRVLDTNLAIKRAKDAKDLGYSRPLFELE